MKTPVGTKCSRGVFFCYGFHCWRLVGACSISVLRGMPWSVVLPVLTCAAMWMSRAKARMMISRVMTPQSGWFPFLSASANIVFSVFSIGTYTQTLTYTYLCYTCNELLHVYYTTCKWHMSMYLQRL
jgi:hypothetical protein